jgi:hypothetical protein
MSHSSRQHSAAPNDPELEVRHSRAASQKYQTDLTAQRSSQRLKEALLQIAGRP